MFFETEEDLVKFVATAKLTDWQRRLMQRNAEAVQVHSQGQIFYKLDRLFPNEQPESKHHRILAFESITEASFGRAANNVNRIFKNTSYTVEASDVTLERLNQDDFEGHNFYTWFLDEWTKWALKQDANARFAIYPPAYVEQEGRPPVVFFASDYLRYEDGETAIFVSEAESVIDYELKEMYLETTTFYDQSINSLNARAAAKNTYTPKLEGQIKRYVYHVFQKGQGFFRMEQVKGGGKEFEVSFYPFPFEEIPVMDVGGEDAGHGINKSFLHPFVAFGNLALLQHSQHCAVNFTFAFPRMAEVETPCDAFGCNQGFVECESEEDLRLFPDGRKPCKVCKGSGSHTPQTPYKIYKKKYDLQGIDGEEKALAFPMVEYYTPPVEVLQYSKQEWRDYLEMAETAVYIQQRVKTGNVEAAKSKEIDREDLYSFLAGVGKVYFKKKRFAIQCFENYYVRNPLQVSVSEPYSYAILTEGEAFTELQNILASNVPVMIKANRVEGFINKFVSQSSPIRKFLEVLKLADPLLYYSSSELQGYKLAGVVTAEQMAVHVFSFPILQRLFTDEKELQLESASVILERLNTELEAFKPEQVKPAFDQFRQGQA